MSTRRHKQGGWCEPAKLPKDAEGFTLCRYYNEAIQPGSGRRTFCSSECVDEWKIRTDAGHARYMVWRRDQGVCAACGVDTVQDVISRTGRPRSNNWKNGDLWQADHIVPVAEGGGECGLEGLRTLCTACHLKATKALRNRLSDARREQKAQKSPQVRMEFIQCQ